MTPAQAIAQLDRQIGAHGQAIAFRRGTTEQSAQGFVRGFKPDELVGMISQADRMVVVSPTTLGNYQPRQDDDFTTSGQIGKVLAAEPVQIGETIVRWNVTVRMA